MPAPMRFDSAYQQVARTIGNKSDSDAQDEAKDAIKAVIDDLNTEWDFEFNLTTVDVTLEADTRDYSVGEAKDLKKIYNIYSQSNNWSLHYISQRLWDRVVSTSDQVGTVVGYNLISQTLGASEEKKLRVLYTPSATETLTAWYYRLIDTPSADADLLDLPQAYQRYLIYAAKAQVLADHGENDNRIAYWEGKAERKLQRMKWTDQEHPDADVGFLPPKVASAVFPLDHPVAAILQSYGY